MPLYDPDPDWDTIAEQQAEVRRILDANPAFARTLRQFTALYDAAEVLEELKQPRHHTVALLRAIADRLMLATGVGEDFIQALIRSRPPLGDAPDGVNH